MTIKASTVSLAAAIVVAAALAVAGCSSSTSGSASPTTTSAAVTTTANPFGAMQACQVLNQLLAGQGFDPGSNKSARNQCTTSKLDFGAYGVVLDPAQGLSEYSTQNPGAVSTQINGRNALQAEPDTGMCEFALEIGQHARALAKATMVPSLRAQACTNAKQLAGKLEPLLPKTQ